MTDRDQMINAHTYLVPLTRQKVVPKAPWRIDPEDLESEGYLGLCRAAEKFDPGRGVRFQTLAISWIRGAMLDYLRAEDWVPRSERDKERRGEPVLIRTLVSWEGLLADPEDGGTSDGEEWLADPGSRPDDLAGLSAGVLWRVVSLLPRRERQVILGRYRDGRLRPEIAAELGLSESRVHQIEQAALSRARGLLGLWREPHGR